MTSGSWNVSLIDKGVSLRAEQLFGKRLDVAHRASDRIFLTLNLLQWAGAIIVALTVSPRTWAGAYSSTHIHVWAAFLLGGTIASLPVTLALFNPGAPLTRHVIAAGQMLWSALLIHLCGGRIETHFHIFGSLAFLAFYRDWRVLVTATLVVCADHFARGIFWPQSVYGVLTASPWRVVEHAAWVAFEDIVLLVSIRGGIRELRDLAHQQAIVEQSHQLVEIEVLQRTEQLRINEIELRQLQKMEAVGQLAGGIAHEFNNLLQAIGGFVTFARDELPEDSQPHEDLTQALAATERSANLTRQLLGFSRRTTLERKSISPNAVIEDLVKMLRPLLGERIHFTVSLDDDISCVHADPTMLQQILMNLCINARDAIPSEGQLTVSTSMVWVTDDHGELFPDLVPGPYVRFAVTDTGCGMTEEVQQRVFEPFFTTKGIGKGTGLGMSMVYGQVRQHGGAITLYSEVGKGTTFKIYLPAIDAATGEQLAPKVVTSLGGMETILIAEDESCVRDVAVRVLRRAGYSTLVAEDGEQALEVFQANEERISLVILDIMMPKLTGHEVYKRICQARPEMPVIFCTGYDPDSSQFGFVETGKLRLIEKPFDLSEMLATVREMLDGRAGLSFPAVATECELQTAR